MAAAEETAFSLEGYRNITEDGGVKLKTIEEGTGAKPAVGEEVIGEPPGAQPRHPTSEDMRPTGRAPRDWR